MILQETKPQNKKEIEAASPPPGGLLSFPHVQAAASCWHIRNLRAGWGLRVSDSRIRPDMG